MNALLQTEKTPIGFIIDESSHEKKGDKSVGVAKQYCGTKGKIENCQIIMQTYIRKDNEYEQVEAQIKYRHKQRLRDVLRPNRKK